MSAPKPLETTLLAPASRLIQAALSEMPPSKRDQVRYALLASIAGEVSGVDRKQVRIDWFPDFDSDLFPRGLTRRIAELIQKSPIPASLALASLAHPFFADAERKTNGAYFTDFRLAAYIASKVRSQRVKTIIDPACGTGILLSASLLRLAGNSRQGLAHLVGSSVCGADLSVDALKGAFISLTSLTSDASALTRAATRLRVMDSLTAGPAAWGDVAPRGFDIVVGNPPWEKLKLTRHEWLRARGVARHYGEAYKTPLPCETLDADREHICTYVERLERIYLHHGGGEQDSFKFFLELSLRLSRRGGNVVLLVPAGLIRSQGTEALRRFAFDSCSDIELTVLENRARFFAIDTRFKFLTFRGTPAKSSKRNAIRLVTADASATKVTVRRTFSIGRTALKSARADLSVPEVRSGGEWQIFRDFVRKGVRFGDAGGPWQPKLMREVDMTRDREHFRNVDSGPENLPVIEGRMVHQFRFPAKRYVSGTGRRARWDPVPERSEPVLRPQYRFPRSRLSMQARERVSILRAGFCDITGQTNERTMLASRIPAGAVCGNKVPTVVFEYADQVALVDCWLAIVNSIPFDWMLRRVVTTTVNYFLLLDLPFPPIDPTSAEGRQLSGIAERLSENRHLSGWEKAELRADVDCRVLAAFGHDARTLESILTDFPLLDRAQKPLPGECHSSITRDLLLLRAAQRLGGISQSGVERFLDRVERARAAGAVPYVPSHLERSAQTALPA